MSDDMDMEEGGTIKKFMFVNRKAPYGTIYAWESLEVVLIGAAFDQEVSLLFVDFADGGRLRVNGRATLHDDAERLAAFPGSECVVDVQVDRVMPSCSANVPRLVPEHAAGGAGP